MSNSIEASYNGEKLYKLAPVYELFVHPKDGLYLSYGMGTFATSDDAERYLDANFPGITKYEPDKFAQSQFENSLDVRPPYGYFYKRTRNVYTSQAPTPMSNGLDPADNLTFTGPNFHVIGLVYHLYIGNPLAEQNKPDVLNNLPQYALSVGHASDVMKYLAANPYLRMRQPDNKVSFSNPLLPREVTSIVQPVSTYHPGGSQK